MKMALQEAELAYQEDEIPVGCIIVQNGEVISCAHNQKEKNFHPLHHAEMLAIEKAVKKLNCRYLLDCDLFVSLEPCIMCTGAIINSRIRRIVFATRDPKGGGVVSSVSLKSLSSINHHPEIKEGILQEDASELLKCFFREKRKQKKNEIVKKDK